MANPVIAEAGGAAVGVGKTVFFGRTTLYLTTFFFVVSGLVGVLDSFAAHSFVPLLSATVFRVLASDHLLGELVQQVVLQPTPVYQGLLTTTFPAYLWFWFKFFWQVLLNLYFVVFAVWLCYKVYDLISNDSALKNGILAVITYAIITTLGGTVLYMMAMAGRTVPANQGEAVMQYANQVYPGEGIIKLGQYYITPDTLRKIAAWEETPLGSFVSDIPTTNTTFNLTNATT